MWYGDSPEIQFSLFSCYLIGIFLIFCFPSKNLSPYSFKNLGKFPNRITISWTFFNRILGLYKLAWNLLFYLPISQIFIDPNDYIRFSLLFKITSRALILRQTSFVVEILISRPFHGSRWSYFPLFDSPTLSFSPSFSFFPFLHLFVFSLPYWFLHLVSCFPCFSFFEKNPDAHQSWTFLFSSG